MSNYLESNAKAVEDLKNGVKMSFFEWTQKHRHWPHLTNLQKSVVTIIASGVDEKTIIHIFDGKKACPYRIVQRIYLEYIYFRDGRWVDFTTPY